MRGVCVQEVKGRSTDANADDHLRDLRDGDDGGGDPLWPGVNSGLRERSREGGEGGRIDRFYELEYKKEESNR